MAVATNYLELPLFSDTTLDRVFVRKGHSWSELRCSAARPNRRLHSGGFALLNDSAPSLPSDLIRADVSTRRQRFILQSVAW
jgi:hypothetical protein